MPTYEYRCKECGRKLSIHRPVEDRDCLPLCVGHTEHPYRMVRTFSFQMAPVFQERYEPSLGVTVSSNRALMDEAKRGRIDDRDIGLARCDDVERAITRFRGQFLPFESVTHAVAQRRLVGQQIVRAFGRARAGHQWCPGSRRNGDRNGLSASSRPSEVSGPWPQCTAVSAGKRRTSVLTEPRSTSSGSP